MPQLDSSSFVSQIFWLAITFFTLWFVMSFFIVPRIGEIIDERRHKIDTDIQKAEKVNQKALHILNRYETMLEKANEEINREVSEKKAQIEASAELKKAEISQYLSQKISDNETLIKKEREETLKAVNDISAQTAELILQKLGLKDTK